MAKDLNGLSMQFALAALKADQVLQATLVAAVVLVVVLASTSSPSPTSSPIPAMPPGMVAPPVPAPAPPVATPGSGTLFNPQPQGPQDKNQAQTPRVLEVKPGQPLDAVATPDKPADSSFGRSRETSKKPVEVRK